MKKGFVVVLVALSIVAGSFTAAMAKFPTKPIKLIVYTKPGGAIDVFARKFTTIAEKYTDATFVVVNKDGAGGMVALKYILAEEADGYQFAAVTKSVIGKIVSTGNKVNLEDLYWMAMLVSRLAMLNPQTGSSAAASGSQFSKNIIPIHGHSCCARWKASTVC